MPKNETRLNRINEELKKELSQVLNYELKNPNVTGMLSVTKVKITPDFKYAKVYVSILNSKNINTKELVKFNGIVYGKSNSMIDYAGNLDNWIGTINFLIVLDVCIILLFIILAILGSPYQSWDYSDPEWSVIGTIWHSFEWIFFKVAPIVVIVITLILAIILIKRNK